MYAIRSYYVIAGAVGGAINGALQVKMHAFAFHSLLSIPAFGPMDQYLIGIVTAFILAMLITLVIGFVITSYSIHYTKLYESLRLYAGCPDYFA